MLNLFRKAQPKIDEHIIRALHQAAEEYEFTPDYHILEQYEYQLLFVYNEFQKGGREHEAFVEFSCLPCGEAFTVDDHFTVWEKRLGKESFPIALVGDRKAPEPWFFSSRRIIDGGVDRFNIRMAPKARIKGELYAVRPYQYLELDKYMDHMVQFERIRVRLVIPYTRIEMDKETTAIVKTHTSHIVRAWMYLGKSDYWSDLLDCGVNFKLIPRYEGHGKLNTFYRYKEDRVK